MRAALARSRPNVLIIAFRRNTVTTAADSSGHAAFIFGNSHISTLFRPRPTEDGQIQSSFTYLCGSVFLGPERGVRDRDGRARRVGQSLDLGTELVRERLHDAGAEPSF